MRADLHALSLSLGPNTVGPGISLSAHASGAMHSDPVPRIYDGHLHVLLAAVEQYC